MGAQHHERRNRAVPAWRVPASIGKSSVGDATLAYQLTLTNDSASTADVTGFAVVFYNSAGTEYGSDQEQASGFITLGQSLSWTVIEDHTLRGYGDDPNEQLSQTANIPLGATTCQLVEWYHQ